MRESSNEVKDGYVYNGFDYRLQVWVVNGVVDPEGCGHGEAMRQNGHCCNGFALKGRTLKDIPGASFEP